MTKYRILIVFGTRPEAIKMAPIIKALKNDPIFDLRVCVTAQHREMLDQVLDLFEINPDYDLNIMKKNQNLGNITSTVLTGLQSILEEYRPDRVLVHGDTTTTLSASLASYYNKIPVGHVEAGLRTGNIYSPWPEEVNRKITGDISDMHFAPTENAFENLVSEGKDPDNIFVTGNSVIDALYDVVEKINNDKTIQQHLDSKFEFLDINKPLILVTGHRRENFGKGIENICKALKKISKQREVQIVYPVHLNPNVQEVVNTALSGIKNIFLIEPLDYLPFVYLMNRSKIILTDSGGIQEEAPSLGKPVFVLRDTTERPEAIDVGTARLVGTNIKKIADSVIQILDNGKLYEQMSKLNNPYGNGTASIKILNALKERLYRNN